MSTYDSQPDGTAGKDTLLESASPTFNYGVITLAQAGEISTGASSYRELIQFDLSSIPATATVNSATLTLRLILDGSARASNNRTLRAYRVKQAWTEGTGNGSATGDGATWNTYNGSSTWQTAGCSGANDVEATDIGSVACATTDLTGDDKAITLTASAVQEWISGAMTNNGLLLKMDTELNDAYRFGSSDNVTASNRPRLVIDYTPAGSMGLPVISHHWQAAH